MPQQSRQPAKILERVCFGLGAMGLLFFGAAMLQGALASSAALYSFEMESSTRQLAASLEPIEPASSNLPLAVLEIDRLDVRVPVFLGTHPLTLNKGAGIVEGTAVPGEIGNIAVAAHRDSHFRPLEQIEVGDLINLRTTEGPKRFQVSEVRITDPLDIGVLDDTDGVTLTLITCYPFRYVGPAPDRYIVRALPVADAI